MCQGGKGNLIASYSMENQQLCSKPAAKKHLRKQIKLRYFIGIKLRYFVGNDSTPPSLQLPQLWASIWTDRMQGSGSTQCLRSVRPLAPLLRRWQVSHLGSRWGGGLGEDTTPTRSSTKSHLSRAKERDIKKAEGSKELHWCWRLMSKSKRDRSESSLLLLQLPTPGPHSP